MKWWIKPLAAFLCAHFIEIIGREESTLELLLEPFYYKDVLSGTVVAWMLFEYLSRIGAWLDKRYDWMAQAAKRFLLQFFFGVLICALLAYFLVNLQFRLVLDQKMEDTTWFYYEFPFVVLLIVLFNVLYATHYFVSRMKETPGTSHARQNSVGIAVVNDQPAHNAVTPRQVLHVKKGNKTIPILTEDVAYIFRNGHASYLRSYADETFLIDETLEDLEHQLDPLSFFRANRQVIINLRACKSFSPEDFGKLKVFLNPPSLEHVIISQKRTPLFKKWLER